MRYALRSRVPTVLLALTATLLFVMTGTAAAHTPGQQEPPCTGVNVRACVDLSRQQAWLMQGGEVVYGPVPIASGREGYPTDLGRFDVDFEDKDHVSSIYNAPMPYSVFYNGGEAFHEGSLEVRSHGCIHLSHQAAKKFYNYLHVGDLVVVRQ